MINTLHLNALSWYAIITKIYMYLITFSLLNKFYFYKIYYSIQRYQIYDKDDKYALYLRFFFFLNFRNLMKFIIYKYRINLERHLLTLIKYLLNIGHWIRSKMF